MSLTVDSGVNESLKVLGIFAHPDDEGFGSGGTLALLARRGHKVTLVCATNGDVGEISDPDLATPETLGQVRQQELREAMAVTGFSDVRFLGYRDSGMDGTPENDHPESLFQATDSEVVARIRAAIDEIKPDLVLTHDPTGGYGHPDHVAVCRHTVSAVEECAAGGGPTPVVYYVCYPRSNFKRMWQQMIDNGITPPFASLEVDKIGSPDEMVTTTVDVSEYVEVKIASLACHRTQMDPNGAFAQLPEHLTKEMMSTEYFALAIAGESSGQNAGESGKGRDLLAELR